MDHVEPTGLLPAGTPARALTLDLFLLEKALHEVGNELSDRPDWVLVPLLGILELLDEPG